MLLVLKGREPGPFAALADADRAGRIELAGGRAQLVLHRRQDTGQWDIASAEDAPADASRIGQLLAALAALSPGQPVAVPPAEPLRLRVSDRRGETLAEAELWPGVVRPLPDGPAFRSALELPPLDPARWSTLEPPRLPPIRAVLRPSPGGPEPVPAPQAAALAGALSKLSAEGWVPARRINWAGADHYQLQTDAGLVEAQVQEAPEGRFVRLTAERLPDIRRARVFAFRLPEAP